MTGHSKTKKRQQINKTGEEMGHCQDDGSLGIVCVFCQQHKLATMCCKYVTFSLWDFAYSHKFARKVAIEYVCLGFAVALNEIEIFQQISSLAFVAKNRRYQ